MLDSNDNAPEFQSDPYDVTVSEALDIDTDVVQVKALDPDFGNNGEVRYTLQHALFSIDTNSGWIRIKNKLDAEHEVRHELIVKAEDGNGLSALSTVRIHVIDVNDNAHKFTQLHYNAAVNENLSDANEKTDTAEQCQKLCQANINCVQFTWIARSDEKIASYHRNCFMKEVFSSSYTFALGRISGPKHCGIFR